MKRSRGEKRELIDSEDESTKDRLGEKKWEEPSREVLELRKKVAHLEKRAQRASRFAREKLEESQKRVEFLEKRLEDDREKPAYDLQKMLNVNKRSSVADEYEKLALELNKTKKKMDMMSMQLEAQVRAARARDVERIDELRRRLAECENTSTAVLLRANNDRIKDNEMLAYLSAKVEEATRDEVEATRKAEEATIKAFEKAQEILALKLEIMDLKSQPPPPAPSLSYFDLSPNPGSPLSDQLVFWQDGAKYCQQKADEVQRMLGHSEKEVDLPRIHTKDDQPTPSRSMAKYCRARDAASGSTYYYNKITRSPTWTLPAGEEADSEDEIMMASANARDEKERCQKKSKLETRSAELLKNTILESMFADAKECKTTIRRIIRACIDKEQKINPNFDYAFSEDFKHRMVNYTTTYVQRHNLKPLQYPK